MATRTLFRPIGEKELILIHENEYRKYPPRLEWQPIFYPVLNEAYAAEIASKWNTTDAFGNYLGFVTRFDLLEDEFNRYKVENVGGPTHNELWVPAEDLERFNEAIVGTIQVTKVFMGDQFHKTTHPCVNDHLERIRNNERTKYNRNIHLYQKHIKMHKK